MLEYRQGSRGSNSTSVKSSRFNLSPSVDFILPIWLFLRFKTSGTSGFLFLTPRTKRKMILFPQVSLIKTWGWVLVDIHWMKCWLLDDGVYGVGVRDAIIGLSWDISPTLLCVWKGWVYRTTWLAHRMLLRIL